MRQFFKQVFASFIGSLAGLIFFSILGTTGLVVLLVSVALKDTSPVVKDKSMLVFDLSMEIKDTPPASSLSQVLKSDDGKSMTLRQVINNIEKATEDKRIIGIFLDGRKSGEYGYANLTEIRAALEKFHAAGKKIIAYGVGWSEKDYYLASVADRVILNPLGEIEINGLSTQQMFLSDALKKYGIGVQVVRVGSYKSAVEPFIRQNLSPENRQQLQGLLSDLWGNVLSTISKSRKVTTQNLQAIADNQGILNSEEAKKAKLIDQVAYLDEVIVDLKKFTGNDKKSQQSFQQISLETYAEVAAKKTDKSSENKIAIVYAEGEIVNGQGTSNQVGGDRFAKELRNIREDKDIKAVVLRINSPGGSATAADIILREVELIQRKKPVIVSMGNLAASGGYWIATGAEHIVANDNTITGSIGVFGLLINLQDIAKNNGITWDGVKTGQFADLGASTRPKTEKELAIFQKSVNQVYNLFLDKVARSRKLSKDKVAAIAQGRVWSGEEAKKIGLVDQIGGLETAIQRAAEQAKLGEDWSIEEYPEKRSFEEEFFEKLLNTEVKNLDTLTIELLKLRAELAKFASLNDPRNIYVYFPFNLEIK
jgi:protease-4